MCSEREREKGRRLVGGAGQDTPSSACSVREPFMRTASGQVAPLQKRRGPRPRAFGWKGLGVRLLLPNQGSGALIVRGVRSAARAMRSSCSW